MVTGFGHPLLCPVIIGRDAAIAACRSWLDRAVSGAGLVGLISGEAGIGKSRLVTETVRQASARGFAVLPCQCFEPDRARPFAPFVDLLQGHPADLPDTILLRSLLGGEPASRSASFEEPGQERYRACNALAAALFETADHQPLLLVVEDIHWADDASIEFLRFLANRIATRPILLLATYRSDDVPPLTRLLADFDRARIAAELRLDPLTEADVRAMVLATLTGDRPAHSDTFRALHELSEGNPFFIEELLSSMGSGGGAVVRWTGGDLDSGVIPRSVRDAVQRRAAAVSRIGLDVLHVAAVAGRRFDITLLQDVLAIDEARLLEVMKELILAQLVIEESTDTFAFRHALTREAIAGDLLLRERRRLHQRIAEATERLAGDAPEAHGSDLAYHYAEAGDWAKTLVYGRQAGAQAEAMRAPRAVVEHYGRVVTASRELGMPMPVDILRARGQAYETIGDFDAARRDFETMIAESRIGHDSAGEARALLDLGFLWAARDYRVAGRRFDAALAKARAADDLALIAQSLNRIGNWHFNTATGADAMPYHREALDLFRQSGDVPGIAETLDLMAMESVNTGNAGQAAGWFDEAIDLFRQLGHYQGLVNSLVTSALVCMVYPGLTFELSPTPVEVGLTRNEEAVAIARDVGWRAGEAFALIDNSYCFVATGDLGRAVTAARTALAIADEIGHRQWAAAARMSLGSIGAGMGAGASAWQMLRDAVSQAEEIDSRYWQYIASTLLTVALVDAGHLDEATQALDRVHAPDAPMTGWLDRSGWLARATLILAQGDPTHALAIVDDLLATVPAAGEGPIIPPLALLRGESLIALGRSGEAVPVLEQAAMVTRERRGAMVLWRVLAALGRAEQVRGHRDASDAALAEARLVAEEIALTLPDEALPEFGTTPARTMVREMASRAIPGPRPLTTLQSMKWAAGGLTARERDVAVRIARGMTNRAIADDLSIGERTVATHVANILTRLDFSSRSQIAAWVAETGLATPPAPASSA